MQTKLNSTSLSKLFRLLDILLILLGAWLAFHLISTVYKPILVGNWSAYYLVVFISTAIHITIGNKSYRALQSRSLPSSLKENLIAWITTAGLLLVGLYLVKSGDQISRSWLLTWVLISLLLLSLERIACHLVLRFTPSIKYYQRSVIVVGSGIVADELIDRIKNSPWLGYYLVEHIAGVEIKDLEALEGRNIDEIWLALPLSDEAKIKTAIHALRHCAASIRYVPDIFASTMVNHRAVEVANTLMFNLSATPITGFNLLLKWLEDKILATLILILAGPVMLIVAAGVKLSSPGPIFYKQERVGLNNQRFMMLKFRSMPVDTEKDSVRWGGAASKVNSRFGQFIRKTSLDELPQFINVLRGDMSIVGPRPERGLFVEEFKEKIPRYMKKHLVKAGITGWAQVNGLRGDTDLTRRIEFDLYYIENWSLGLDIKIILMTILTVLLDGRR